MKKFKTKLVVFMAIAVGTVIGTFKGEEAKQKWVFKIRSKHENKRLIAERRTIIRNGGVLLDEVELAAFHNN